MVQGNSPQVLVTKAKNGSIEALNTLLEAYKQHIFAISYGLLNDKNYAAKAMRDALITVWKNIGLMEDDEDFENWLYRIVYVVSEELRSEMGKTPNVKTDKLVPRITSSNKLLLPQRYAAQEDLKERLTQIIFSLPDRQRETIILYYYNSKTIDDIAEIMDCTERKVQSRLYLAHKAIKEAVIEQEQQHGEQYFTTEPGAVSLGSFVAYHIDRNLPTRQEIAQILDSSRSDAYFSNQTYTAKLPKKTKKKSKPKRIRAERSAKPAKSSAPKDPTAAAQPQNDRDYTIVIKIIIAALILALLVSLGFLVYNVFSCRSADSSNPAASQELTTQAQQTDNKEGAAAQTAATEASEATVSATDSAAVSPTAPTEKSTVSAKSVYRAYRGVLEDNEDKIKAYNWQYRVDPAHPIAFADVMGDSEPEMIYASATGIGSGGDDYLTLHVMTFDGTKAVEACRYELTDNTRRSGGIYCVTQISGERNLYTFSVTSPGELRTETAYRYISVGGNTLRQEEAVVYNPRTELCDEERVNGKDVTAEEAKDAYYSLAAKSSVLLLSSSDSRGVGYPSILNIDAENKAMTYDEAMDYLNTQIN